MSSAKVPAYAWAMCVFLVLNCMSGNWWITPVHVPLDRLALFAALALAAVDPGVHERIRRMRWQPLHTLMLAMVAWTAWSAWTHHTLTTGLGFYALLDRVAMPFLMFLLAPLVFPGPAERRLLLGALTVLGCYLGLMAVFQVVGPQQLVVPSFISDPQVGIHVDRARGPFLSAEPNGVMLGICGIAAGVFYTRTRGWWQWAALACLPLCAAGVVLCLTRSVWLGTAVALVVTCYLVPPLRRPALIGVGCAVVIFAVAVGADSGLREQLVERLTTQRSLDDRTLTNAAAWRVVQAHPIQGIGWGRFWLDGETWVRQMDLVPLTNVHIEVHNVPLARACELGLVGFGLWLATLLMGPVKAVFARYQGELLGWHVLGCSALVLWLAPTMLSPNPYPLINNIMWLLTGLLAGAAGTTAAVARTRQQPAEVSR